MSSADVHDLLQVELGSAYRIEREIAAGGMSRVFVAAEAALGRTVVVKVLRRDLAEELSADRFRREVRLAARLQHPHIVPLLTAGELSGGILYYTMPFVEGESLRDRLAREGALPLEDAVRIARDVSSALDYAHRAGVVHRDIKPDNVLLADGGAVVADFGIAKAIHASREEDDRARRTSTLTAAGTSLGTPAYMSPEQAAADAVDHRADLYALGVVLYEMLCGHAPFEGRTGRQLLAAHATEAPEPVTKRRPTVPPALGTLVARLLEKSPADRPQSAAEVIHALDGVARAAPWRTSASRAALESIRGEWRRAAAVVAVAVAAALLGGAAGVWLGATRSQSNAYAAPVVSFVQAPTGLELRPDDGFALSPDGRRLALVAADPVGATAIWVRPLDSLGAVRVMGSDRGVGPFWSPDGTSLGYFANGRLWVVDVRSGARRDLCPAPRPGGGTWTPGGVIVYAPSFLGSPLYRVSAGGGDCVPLTRLRPGDVDHRRPSALPDGRHVVFTTGRTSDALVVDLRDGRIDVLRTPGNDAQFAPPHWLLFRDAIGGPLLAQRFDPEDVRLIGEPRVLLDRVSGMRARVGYSAVAGALVAMQPASAGRTLVWVDRQSAVLDSAPDPTDRGALFGNGTLALSHDGRRLALAAGGPMWIHDLDRRVATRVRAETIVGQGILDPDWSPDDSRIVYRTLWRGTPGLRLYDVRTDASDSLFALRSRVVRMPVWSADGRRVAFQLIAGDTASKDEIWIYSLDERTAARAWETTGNLSFPRWSPDGRWIAYVSDETGAPEVYVRPATGTGAPARASTAGGDIPRWRADGRELYYRTPAGAIAAVVVGPGGTASLSPPRVVVASPPTSHLVRTFEPTRDGTRFVAFGREDPPTLTLLLGWAARLAP